MLKIECEPIFLLEPVFFRLILKERSLKRNCLFLWHSFKSISSGINWIFANLSIYEDLFGEYFKEYMPLFVQTQYQFCNVKLFTQWLTGKLSKHINIDSLGPFVQNLKSVCLFKLYLKINYF